MTKKRELSDAEKALLKAAMKDVVPLKKRPLAESPAPEKIKPAVTRKAKLPPPPLPPVSVPGPADTKTVRRVRQGDYPVEATLDLHGMTLEDAHAALAAFVESSARHGRRALLVITGKSGALRREVPRWLALSSLSRRILVVSSAQARHGGQGALYLLLRRKK